MSLVLSKQQLAQRVATHARLVDESRHSENVLEYNSLTGLLEVWHW